MKLEKLLESIDELLVAVDLFVPNDKTLQAYAALAPENGQPRSYGTTCNLSADGGMVRYTDHDAIKLRKAVDLVKKMRQA